MVRIAQYVAMKHTPAALALTVSALQAETGFSENHIRNLIARKELPCVRSGRAIRVLRRDLEDYLNRNRIPGREEQSGARTL